jgi:aspartate aminotransferase
LENSYEAAIIAGGNPRIMLINSPSNPTGQTFSAENLKVIVDFCKAKRVLLISDEIYSDINFDDNSSSASPLQQANQDVLTSPIVVTGGLSKVSLDCCKMIYCMLIRF